MVCCFYGGCLLLLLKELCAGNTTKTQAPAKWRSCAQAFVGRDEVLAAQAVSHQTAAPLVWRWRWRLEETRASTAPSCRSAAAPAAAAAGAGTRSPRATTAATSGGAFVAVAAAALAPRARPRRLGLPVRRRLSAASHQRPANGWTLRGRVKQKRQQHNRKRQGTGGVRGRAKRGVHAHCRLQPKLRF